MPSRTAVTRGRCSTGWTNWNAKKTRSKLASPRPRCHASNIAEIYSAKIQRLENALARPNDAREAVEAMRALIEKIVLTPGVKRGQVKAELHSELAAILALASGQKPRPVLDHEYMRFPAVARERNTLSALFVVMRSPPNP